MGIIKDSLTFDDVSLVPQYSSVLPSEADTFTELSGNVNLQIPLMSSAMDTVTESKMAIEISKLGGIGVIH
jgi:IMP dehydrogenase